MAPSGPSTDDASRLPPSGTRAMTESDLARKRARDRKAQQAMRDRNKWTLQALTQQVAYLTHALETETRQNGALTAKVQALENENDSLRVQNAALRLKLLGAPDGGHGADGEDSVSGPQPQWEKMPTNTPPTCLSDQILQTFLSSQRKITVAKLLNEPANGQLPLSPESTATSPAATSPRPTIYPQRLNLCPLLDKSLRSDDETSNVVGDIVRSYTEIETLPKQVAVHYLMSTVLHWQLLQDEESWAQMPVWLRPEPKQLSTPHAAWIDRIPWPEARNYLVDHPEITLDAFAAVYSSSFDISWAYDPSHVIIQSAALPKEAFINPIYEEHVRQLKNWSIGEPFRNRFPELSQVIDEHPEVS